MRANFIPLPFHMSNIYAFVPTSHLDHSWDPIHYLLIFCPPHKLMDCLPQLHILLFPVLNFTYARSSIHHDILAHLRLLVYCLSVLARLRSHSLLPTSPPAAAIWFHEITTFSLYNNISIYYSTQFMFLFFSALRFQRVVSIYPWMSVTSTAPYQICFSVTP